MTTQPAIAPAPAGGRAELLVLAAVTLAGAVAGVLVQAGVELARDRHNTHEQLQLAGEQLDALDAALNAWRHEAIEHSRTVGQLREQLDDVWAERDQARDRVQELLDGRTELLNRINAHCEGCSARDDHPPAPEVPA